MWPKLRSDKTKKGIEFFEELFANFQIFVLYWVICPSLKIRINWKIEISLWFVYKLQELRCRFLRFLSRRDIKYIEGGKVS